MPTNIVFETRNIELTENRRERRKKWKQLKSI
jgi:hypothetical protein